MDNLNERQIDTCAQSKNIDSCINNEIEIASKLISSYYGVKLPIQHLTNTLKLVSICDSV